jgi:S-adenosylmethionine:tRNA ribosyltransferase-isomerase
MHLSDFDYDLPPALIARHPVEPRDASRMLVLEAAGSFTDSHFRNLPEFLRSGDVLVLNDTRVIRARTQAVLERQGGTSRPLEVFFAEPLTATTWRVLCKPGRRIRSGDYAVFGNNESRGVFRGSLDGGLHILELETADLVLERFGKLPLPPYLEREADAADEAHYQTVFASRPGAVAAPTAGLHFTATMLDVLRKQGVQIVTITLHVGIGTFLPVRTERPEEHVLHPERYEVSQDTASILQKAVRDRRRVFAVGTTTTRTLEYLMLKHGEIVPGAGSTDLYILPGYQFRLVSGLLTNFHLPRSTLLMLVSALAGRENLLAAYRHAVEAKYRFYSYGDCMLILR